MIEEQGAWPIEYNEQLVIGNPRSNIAICCFWSDRKQLGTLLPSDGYAVIGNLYSRAGINPMIRNILANPAIRYLIITGRSLTDSEQALLSFFESGLDTDWRIMGGHGQIDKDIPIGAVEDIRKSVQIIDLRGAKDFPSEFRTAVAALPKLPPFAEPRVFPKSQGVSDTLPSEFAGFIVRQPSILEAWTEILWTVMSFGHVYPTDYGLEQKEVLGLVSVIENPNPCLGKLPNWSPFRSEDVEKYVHAFFEPNRKEDIAYNYGYRLQSHWQTDQIQAMTAELARSGCSRRAMMSLWDPTIDGSSSEPPCITTVQAVVRDKRLHLAAYIRSNDMFRAYPLNAAALAELQTQLAETLPCVSTGPLIIVSFSAHIYSDCWDACAPAVDEMSRLRQRFEQDHRGNFVLAYNEDNLIAQHFSPDGDLVQTFERGDEASLRRDISPFIGRVDHALYLGKEVNRLMSSRLKGKSYEQEKVE